MDILGGSRANFLQIILDFILFYIFFLEFFRINFPVASYSISDVSTFINASSKPTCCSLNRECVTYYASKPRRDRERVFVWL